jgi:uroporphyrinogen III methyltransferase/synthase
MAKDPQFHSSRKPLDDRTVIITRQKDRAAEMAMILEQAGATVIYCPTIKTVPPDSWSGLDKAIYRISSYDWIVFTSANGVQFFNQRLSELGIGISILNSLISCAIGPATAAALQSSGARVDITAADSRAEGVLEAIISHIGSVDSVRGLRFLIPRAQVARELIPTVLRKLGATVDAVDAYRTIKPDPGDDAITRLLQERRVSAITFTSPSTVEHFADLIGSADLPVLLSGVLIACIGPVTAAAARQRGLERIIQPESHNGEALARIIVDALTQPNPPEPLTR